MNQSDTQSSARPESANPSDHPAEFDDRTLIAPACMNAGSTTTVSPSEKVNSPEYDDRTLIAPTPQTASTLTRFGVGGVAPGTTATGITGQVGRYQILERLGQGAMAVVHKAYDPSINRTLAIKFLHPQLCIDEEYRGRFVQEARAAGNLSHPNIATVFDVGEIDGQPYIAMELLEGDALNDVMETDGAMPIKDVLEIGIQLAGALDYAHTRGIIHRDIKPSNLLRLKDRHSIKVTDFGIAHIESSGSAQQTKMGAVLGTPQYMSPEQALGQSVDGRSDLFSVGVVLYQLATGKQPFKGDSLMSLMQQIVKEEPKPIEQWRPEVPPALRRIINRCLSKQPDKRYATGRELKEALTKVLQDVNEEAEQQKFSKYLPLRVKWALIMGLVIAITMSISATVLHKRQHSALMMQVMDYGASLSKFMATESAVPILTEDWVAIDVFVQEAMRTQDFHSISVIDHLGLVRVSSLQNLVGKPYGTPKELKPIADHSGARVTHYLSGQNTGVISFEAPITFQNKTIGQVHLGILEKPLTKVTQLSFTLMVMLVLITVSAAIVATYFMANRYSKPIKLIKESMKEIGKGHLDYRIVEYRKDEFGEIYLAFDEMAALLQAQVEKTGTDAAKVDQTNH